METAPGAPARVRLAVVGVGHLGRHHVRVARDLPGVDLIGISDHHDGRAEEAAREGNLRVFPGPAEVAATAQAVVIATPTSSHAELGRFFLESGVDVLMEKPIASSLAEADGLVRLARSRGRILQVGHVERYNPAVEAVLARVHDPLFVEVHRLGVFAPRSLDLDVVRDLMIHDLQIVTELVGRPIREIHAVGIPILTPQLDIAHARIAFEGGCVANLTASRVSSERMRKLRVFAPALYCSADMHARRVEAFRLDRGSGDPRIVPEALSVEDADPLSRELSDFLRAVRTRGEPLVTGEVGRDALALAERVIASAEAHRRGVQAVSA
ncbi:MAG: Gfo/Idh/MocA family oxidoreductase [Acidobacteriota bacterium]